MQILTNIVEWQEECSTSNLKTLTAFPHLKVSIFSGFEKDPKKSKFEFYCMVPKLSIVGHYKVGGKVIVLPVTGEGPVNLTFGINVCNALTSNFVQQKNVSS